MAEMEDEDVAAPENKGGGLLKMVLAGAGALALLAVGILAGPAIQGLLAGETPGEEPAAAAAGEPAAQSERDKDPAIYQGLHPALVVNFRDALGEPHFMQLEMEVMARDQGVINAVREHTPVIRNNLILLYGNVKYEDVTTRAGKERMLADGLAEIQRIMAERVGEPNVEALYFTSLIIQ